MRYEDWKPLEGIASKDQIRFIIECIGQNEGWMNGLKWLPYLDDVMLINAIGGRGCGKTDFGLLMSLMLYQQFGCQTVWIRHKLVELTDEGNYNDFLNDAKALGWCPDRYDCRKDGIYDSTDKDADKLILFASVSTFSNKRGTGHPRILLSIFDEMIPEDGKYKPNAALCVRGLLSLMESMTRGRDGSYLIVFSNYVSAGNPYWAKFEIYNNPKYDVTVFRDKAILIEVCRGYRRARKEDSKLTKLMRAGKMPLYEDERADPLIGLVERMPNGAKPMPYILLTDGQYYREFTHKGLSYWVQHKGNVPNNLAIITPNVNECGPNVFMAPPHFYKRIEDDMASDLIRFASPNVMWKILNTIYERG